MITISAHRVLTGNKKNSLRPLCSLRLKKHHSALGRVRPHAEMRSRGGFKNRFARMVNGFMGFKLPNKNLRGSASPRETKKSFPEPGRVLIIFSVRISRTSLLLSHGFHLYQERQFAPDESIRHFNCCVHWNLPVVGNDTGMPVFPRGRLDSSACHYIVRKYFVQFFN